MNGCWVALLVSAALWVGLLLGAYVVIAATWGI